MNRVCKVLIGSRRRADTVSSEVSPSARRRGPGLPRGVRRVAQALSRLAATEPAKADLVKLRFFAGLTMPEAAATLDISLATAERHWTFAKAWLYAELADDRQPMVDIFSLRSGSRGHPVHSVFAARRTNRRPFGVLANRRRRAPLVSNQKASGRYSRNTARRPRGKDRRGRCY